MKTIVFLGTHKSGSSREAIRAAQNMGYFTCLLTNIQKHIRQRNEYPDVHHMQYCDLDDISKIREAIDKLKHKSLQISSIISFIDPWCGVAASLAKEYGVENFTYDAIFKMQNKQISRELIKGTIYAPKYYACKNVEEIKKIEIENILPVVVKYVDSNGSKDVYHCTTKESYYLNLNKILNRYPNGTILIEEFLDGPQYLIETIVIDKKVNIVAIIKQDISVINDHFIITGYKLCLDYTDEFYNKLYTAVQDIIEKHNYQFGPCHLEMRLVKGIWKLVEVNPRISGAGMNDLLEIGLGVNLVKETLNMALGLPYELVPKYKKYTYAEYLVVSKAGRLISVTGINRSLKCDGVKLIYVRPRKGSKLITPISLGNRYAHVIATGNSEEEAITNAKTAASYIEFNLSEN